MARRKNTKFIDPRYFMNEKMERLIEEELRSVLSEQYSSSDWDRAMQFREPLPDIIRKAGGKLHQGDLLDHGLKGRDINHFMGMIKMVPEVGVFDDGTKIIQDSNYLMIQ
jgi:hypothetical protein